MSLYIFLFKLNDASIYIFVARLYFQVNFSVINSNKYIFKGNLLKHEVMNKSKWNEIFMWNMVSWSWWFNKVVRLFVEISTSYLCKFIFVIHLSFFVHSHDLLLLRIIYSQLHHIIIAEIQFNLKMESKNVKCMLYDKINVSYF